MKRGLRANDCINHKNAAIAACNKLFTLYCVKLSSAFCILKEAMSELNVIISIKKNCLLEMRYACHFNFLLSILILYLIVYPNKFLMTMCSNI